MVVKKYKVDESIKAKLRELYEPNNYSSVISIALDWLAIAGAILLNNYLLRLSVAAGLVFYPVALLVIGGRMRALACLLHQSSHRSLAKSQFLNDFLGSTLSGWCVLQSWTGYFQNHIKLHHPYLGNPDKDPDYRQMLDTGLYAEKTTRADVVSYLKSIPSPRFTLIYVQYLVKDRVFPAGEKVTETVLRLCFWAAVIGVLAYTGNVQNFVAFWLVPLLTTANWIGNLAEMLEHFPFMNRDVCELVASRNRLCSRLENFLFGPHGDNYHLVHHLFPRIPHWHYERAHAILLQDDTYRAMHEHAPSSMSAIIHDMLSHVDNNN